jgi:hypothetical protein
VDAYWPQQRAYPSLRTAQAVWFPDETCTYFPAGTLSWPYVLSPQQTTAPFGYSRQLWAPPASISENTVHESPVQATLSLQVTCGCVQVPPEHTSVVQSSPSLAQGRVLFAWAQPEAGLQESVVQTLESSQFGAGPPTQALPEQVSPVVQALLSLQEAVLAGWVHAPPEHTSFVHTLPSSAQASVLFVWVHPVAGTQPSVVHTFESSQVLTWVHWPPAPHTSFVQALLSLSQGPGASPYTQPIMYWQVSDVQTLLSLQSRGPVEVHTLFWVSQYSHPLQGSRSS